MIFIRSQNLTCVCPHFYTKIEIYLLYFCLILGILNNSYFVHTIIYELFSRTFVLFRYNVSATDLLLVPIEKIYIIDIF